MQDQGGRIQVYVTRDAIGEGYSIVIACGGDGTVGEAAHGLIGSKVTLGIMPLGSANNVARMMHVPFDLEEAGKLLRLGEVRRVDVGKCNGEYFLETAGIGLDAALFPIMNQVDKGEYTRLIDAVKTFFRFRPRRLTLVLDRRAVRVRALLVLVANGPYWGYSVPLAPDAKVDDRKFDIIVFRNFSKWQFAKHVIGSLLNRDKLEDTSGRSRSQRIYNPDIKTYRARQVRVLTRGRRPWPVHADAQPDPHARPDRRHLAYVAVRGGNEDVYLRDLKTGEERRLTTHPGRDRDPAWLDDRTVVFASDRGRGLGYTAIFTIGVRGQGSGVREGASDPDP